MIPCMTPLAVVYFAARHDKVGPIEYVLCRLAELATGSNLLHVCIGFGGAVLDPSVAGQRFWGSTPFTLAYPGLKLAVVVRLKRPIDLEAGLDTHPRSRLWVVLRWLTRGRWPCRDCVQEVARHLRAGGLDIPCRITTPEELLDALRKHPHVTETLG